MRCPKCGYISFDGIETCAKCTTVFSEGDRSFSGTVFKGGASFFLASVFEDTPGEVADLGELELGEEHAQAVEVEDVGVDAGEIEFAEEGEVPKVDLSQFEDVPEEEGIEFELEEEAEPELALSMDEKEDLPDLELESSPEEATGIAFDDDQMPELDLSLPEDAPVAEKASTEPGADLKLDLDVDLEDEPADEDMVFNLEDIDMSDLVIEDEDSSEVSEESAIDLENFLNEGGDSDGKIPMDLSLEDGQLVDGKKEEGGDDLPEIE